jgi:thioredoxin-dependent peroxiredoxin
MRTVAFAFVLFVSSCSSSQAPPTAGAQAPALKGTLEDGSVFDLRSRKGQWTVLYFYPKDGTPGCTKQACAFRDATQKIEKLGAKVYGISRDSAAKHRDFIAEHKLSFSLVADDDGTLANTWGVSGLLGMSKRWTFLVGPDLVIREVQPDVDPALNAQAVAASLEHLQARTPGETRVEN